MEVLYNNYYYSASNAGAKRNLAPLSRFRSGARRDHGSLLRKDRSRGPTIPRIKYLVDEISHDTGSNNYNSITRCLRKNTSVVRLLYMIPIV